MIGLIYLDLSYNKLQSVPNLSKLPRLEQLFLNNNEISKVMTSKLKIYFK
jgi:Leucine-rich repeat (LRR) protein